LISWKTKKQGTISKSSSESEYRVFASTSCEIQWISYLLEDLEITTTSVANLYCDNQPTRHIAHNNSFHEQTQHIDIDHHMVRERWQPGLFHLLPIRSSEQPANLFTKALEKKVFNKIISKLRVSSSKNQIKRK